jgi:hypothetical protein
MPETIIEVVNISTATDWFLGTEGATLNEAVPIVAFALVRTMDDSSIPAIYTRIMPVFAHHFISNDYVGEKFEDNIDLVHRCQMNLSDPNSD